MKHLRQFCATIVLVLVLTGAASADGIIHGGSPAPAPPPPQPTTVTQTVDSSEETQSEETTVDTATEIALSLIRSMLSLF
jgi:hypothetical protein